MTNIRSQNPYSKNFEHTFWKIWEAGFRAGQLDASSAIMEAYCKRPKRTERRSND